MGRRKKGRAVSGWIVIDKPAGLSSNAVVGKVRWAFDAQKAGHAGTLDPEATGVLAIALGEATKTVPFVTDALKAYEFTVRLGQATNTDDGEGEVTETSDARPSDDEIRAALPPFEGDILQVPPQFSAVKIDGERAYARARAGQEMEIAARPLYVDSLTFIARPDPDHVTLEMVCGKGGYVRSIARDLGRALGCFGHVKSLRRTWSGPFELSDATPLETLEDLAKDPALDAHLMPLETGLADLPELPCTPEGAARMRNGNPGMVRASDAEYGETAWASYNGTAVAVGTYRAGELHPTRVFQHGAL
ncbi:tRNA pseudouridine synthase B [Dinoroseobacter shibae DFL 12 = DSM 16493]|jgi:tRNA pseudouridine55 synthase|uniref:tRNA pseudouridine synthase B n=1 Tax=Dinoroseobacter shibae (strain DSM 16493 / NCIMB 14021 / DFL 12) TaxID=398580 RepID=TRUB_DINSH|nr:tRNA pseudouridine(55) synthase TruB [Dinoroseobacter shibae]A8LL26.1 RecName: Full=tRNA pseudouridine synthase B; AltName: Full=tRNA pseudouridine(55) synthase; Short=Psi55 synthase; AltName: Full=tRNA pseudouridylate synthase; AltName: Full=tRNA-uridine isomerase [Dinoroseobacter shibae DFL 12 = DSM 16493]ABV94775.1 tRNA pseudouridine synthase B [Dinoroseobacter shibae DFL 12 = DSM 16493]URF46195.1 tRNA pseudouridine(55) synthase TruB [Dinoroseobacter shibae]URF50502.1 tRNA pseudouridine(5